MKVGKSGRVVVRRWTGWFTPAVVRAEADGYPPCEVTVRPLSRASVQYPRYCRPAVLLRPTDELRDLLRYRQAVTLRVLVADDAAVSEQAAAAGRIENYRGGPVWVGTDKELEWPAAAGPETQPAAPASFLSLPVALRDGLWVRPVIEQPAPEPTKMYPPFRIDWKEPRSAPYVHVLPVDPSGSR